MIAQARVSLSRIQDFLGEEEMDFTATKHNPRAGTHLHTLLFLNRNTSNR